MLNVGVMQVDGVVVVHADGRIDSNNANELGVALSGVIDDGQIHIVLDISTVSYMSSAGLRELVIALKKVRTVATGDMCLVQPTDRVMEVLEMAGLDTVFEIFPSQDEAVSSF